MVSAKLDETLVQGLGDHLAIVRARLEDSV
jgi:hypothetical protein